MLVSAEEVLKAKGGHVILPDICVCCGNPIPEGRQVCWICEHQGKENKQEEKESNED